VEHGAATCEGVSYGVNIEAHWFMGRYVLPGNLEKVILKPKQQHSPGELVARLEHYQVAVLATELAATQRLLDSYLEG
jgi:hypothetical protein